MRFSLSLQTGATLIGALLLLTTPALAAIARVDDLLDNLPSCVERCAQATANTMGCAARGGDWEDNLACICAKGTSTFASDTTSCINASKVASCVRFKANSTGMAYVTKSLTGVCGSTATVTANSSPHKGSASNLSAAEAKPHDDDDDDDDGKYTDYSDAGFTVAPAMSLLVAVATTALAVLAISSATIV